MIDDRIEAAADRFARIGSHPAKLAVDVVALSAAMVPLWSHHWVTALLVLAIPDLLAVVAVAAFDPHRTTERLSTVAQVGRVLALVLAVVAAWNRAAVLLAVALIASVLLVLPWRTGWLRRVPVAPDRPSELPEPK
jgi:hypothetical protein